MALSTAMATFGIMSFLVTVRNTVPAVYRDIYLLRNHQRMMKNSESLFDTQEICLNEWANKWMIGDQNEEEDLWQVFWGNGVEYNRIREELNDIHSQYKELKEGIERFTRRRFRYVLYKKPIIDDQLKVLKERIEGLALKADSAFRAKRGGRHPEDRYIKEIGNQHRLLQLARRTTDNSNALFDSCTLAQTELCLELELNFFSASLAGTREQAISKSSRDGRLYSHFLTKLKSKPDDLVIRTQIHCAPEPESDTAQPSTVHVAFRRAFEEMVNHTGSSHRFEAPGGQVYRLQRAQDQSLYGNESTTQYRAILMSEPQVNAHILHFQQRRQDLVKMELAFQVAECGLFLLQSSWFPYLCSCALRHMKLSSGESYGSYLLRKDITPHYRTPPDLCWCRLDPTGDPWRGMRLRYLGVFLIEIALRRPIYDVRLQVTNTELEFQRQANGVWESMFDIFTLVQTECRGGRYREVVEFCITNTWTTSEFDIEAYYSNVLAPYVSTARIIYHC